MSREISAKLMAELSNVTPLAKSTVRTSSSSQRSVDKEVSFDSLIFWPMVFSWVLTNGVCVVAEVDDVDELRPHAVKRTAHKKQLHPHPRLEGEMEPNEWKIKGNIL